MSVIEGFTESSRRNVGVHLSGRQRLVAQEFLNAPEISSRVEQVGCKRVSEGVRTDLGVQSCFFQIFGNLAAYRSGGKSTAMFVDKQGAGGPVFIGRRLESLFNNSR